MTGGQRGGGGGLGVGSTNNENGGNVSVAGGGGRKRELPTTLQLSKEQTFRGGGRIQEGGGGWCEVGGS